MIFVTGDTHGEIDFAKLNDLKKKKVTRDDILIIRGDVGVCWSEHDLPRMVQMYESIGCTIFFVDGNHDNFTMLQSNFPLVHRYGAKMHQISKYIYHVLKGEIMERVLAKAILITQTIELIANKYKLSIKDARNRFYKSRVIELLDDDETGLYGESAQYLLCLFDQENHK